MNSTNRGLNRFFIFVVGVVLLLVGLMAVILNAVPAVRNGWKSSAPVVRRNVDGAFGASSVFASSVSWLGLAVVAVLIVLIILLGVFIMKQGHGRTNRLIRDGQTEHGVTVVESAVAEHMLTNALNDRPELISAAVSTFEVQGTPTLNISVTARRGVSPKEVAVAVEDAVRALDAVLGREIPTVLQIGGGFRARTSSATRLH